MLSHVHFKRLGGDKPVSEEAKRQALSSADLALSLVDNTQETFGLAIAEAMAAGLPVIASNWNGYRDLVRHGVDGYLVPSSLVVHGSCCRFSTIGLAAVFRGSSLSSCGWCFGSVGST